MKSAHIKLVQDSWKLVAPIADDTAAMFYAKLFEINPALQPLFRGDMREQGRKLMAIITTAVNSLTKLETIIVAVQDLGRRHGDYGVEQQDYDTVAEALLWTLEKSLGAAWNEDLKAAWVETYTTLAGIMVAAAGETVNRKVG